MPVSGFEYNTRPYSSFRANRGSCALQHHTTATYLQQQQQQQPGNHNCSKTSLNTPTNSGNPLQTSSSANSIAIRTNCNNNNSNSNSGSSSNFVRQQPLRSSFYGTRYNHKCAAESSASVNNSSRLSTATNGATVSVKPLTPKLVKRIESTCTQHHTKARAPNPPGQHQCNSNGTINNTTTTSTTTTTMNGVHSTPPTAHKQYLRPRNLPPTPPLRKSSNFDRFHQANLSIRQKTNTTAAAAANSHINNRSSAISSSHGSQESLIPKVSGAVSPNGGGSASSLTQKRAYANTVSKVAKENQPRDTTNGSQNGPLKSTKSYPAPLPPGRKCKEEPRLSSVSASPNLSQRRFISSVGINSFNAACNAKALPPLQRSKRYPNNSINSNSGAEQSPALQRSKRYPNNSTNSNSEAAYMTPFQRSKKYTTNPANGNSATAIPPKTGSAGSNSSSNQSSGSQGSPKSKKAFSTKFPQGLPFEDEFYRRNRSYSQSSSSNYSFYSSNGGGGGGAGGTTPQTPRDYDAEEDDEFQRKPSTDEPLYVDFTKVMHHHRRHDYNTKSHTNHTTNNAATASSPQTTWIGCSSKPPQTTNYDASLNSPHSQRRYSHQHPPLYNNANNSTETLNATTTTTSTSSIRSKTKYSNCINDYLYASNGKLSNHSATTSDSRKSHLYSSKNLDPYHQADNGYYTHASPDSSPPPAPHKQTDIYTAVSSWAPKCSHPTKVQISADSNNNKKDYNDKQLQQRYHHQFGAGDKYYVGKAADKSDGVLEHTNSEYSFDSSSRRRKERSKRSHRKSPTSGRRVHNKYRYRDDTSHSSSRRRHRDRAKDERDSGRINRRSHSKEIRHGSLPKRHSYPSSTSSLEAGELQDTLRDNRLRTRQTFITTSTSASASST